MFLDKLLSLRFFFNVTVIYGRVIVEGKRWIKKMTFISVLFIVSWMNNCNFIKMKRLIVIIVQSAHWRKTIYEKFVVNIKYFIAFILNRFLPININIVTIVLNCVFIQFRYKEKRFIWRLKIQISTKFCGMGLKGRLRGAFSGGEIQRLRRLGHEAHTPNVLVGVSD